MIPERDSAQRDTMLLMVPVAKGILNTLPSISCVLLILTEGAANDVFQAIISHFQRSNPHNICTDILYSL